MLRERVLSWPWPLPALLCWALAWSLYLLLRRAAAVDAAPAVACACALAVGIAWRERRLWRRALMMLGFPLSVLALQGMHAMPAWAWLAAAVALFASYPLRAWRDAPFFPTRLHALDGLQRRVELADRASILDAGCGLGHGLLALQRVFPHARLQGCEWSRVLAWGAAVRVPAARIARGDMWAQSWAAHDLVYLFQRPESMARAWAKAQGEMHEGGWLVSLEFEVPGVAPVAVLDNEGHRKAWIYRVHRPTT